MKTLNTFTLIAIALTSTLAHASKSSPLSMLITRCETSDAKTSVSVYVNALDLLNARPNQDMQAILASQNQIGASDEEGFAVEGKLKIEQKQIGAGTQYQFTGFDRNTSMKIDISRNSEHKLIATGEFSRDEQTQSVACKFFK